MYTYTHLNIQVATKCPWPASPKASRMRPRPIGSRGSGGAQHQEVQEQSVPWKDCSLEELAGFQKIGGAPNHLMVDHFSCATYGDLGSPKNFKNPQNADFTNKYSDLRGM